MLALLTAVVFDRYRDRYQNGNPRTIWHKADVAFPVSERNDTGRTRAYTEPPNSGPGGQELVRIRVPRSDGGATRNANDRAHAAVSDGLVPQPICSLGRCRM